MRILGRLLPYWREAWRETVAGALLLVIAAALELLQPWPLKWLVDYVFAKQPAPAWLPLGTTAQSIALVAGAIVGLALAHRVANVLSNMLLIRAGSRLVLRLRCEACDRLHRLSLAYHDRTKVGESLYRVAYDAHAAQALLSGALVPIVTGTLLLIGILTVMLRLDVGLTMLTLAVTPVFFLTIRVFGSRIDQWSKRYHQNESALVATIQESLSSIRAVQAFTLEPETQQRFRTEAQASLQAHERLTRAQLLFSGCVGVAMAVGTAGVVWLGAQRVVDGRLLVGDILVFLAYLGMLYQPMNAFCQSASVVQSAGAQLRRVFELIDAVPEVKDQPGAATLPALRGAIEFRNVSFHYQREQAVLHDVSFQVQPGQVVAIVGRTGAGKTTLTSLLMRFYDPTGGAVLLDGRDLRELKLAWLRQQISVVLQDPILFSATIAENIAYGRSGATRAEIEAAARRAQADEFIRGLPAGYETMLGERGVNLSGGQRQRLSIARALLKNAPILVFDEPTSALDTQTEQALLAGLAELARDRTVFIIAHRLSTVRLADFIIALDAGRLAESGPHAELLERDGVYARMYHAQRGPSASLEKVPVARA